MKRTLILVSLATTLLFVACKKDGMMNDTLGVDTKKYQKSLSIDYSNALVNHNALNSSTVSTSDHNAHHGGSGTTTATVDTSYFKMMFTKNDSLFSEDFYKFCIDMMQNSGMMSTSNGTMGSNSGMMGGSGGMMGGTGGMMNGTTMGGMADMNAMMSYMDSIHKSTETMMNPDYMKTDSLMHSQMTQCKMMTTQTDSIEIIFGFMQMLRGNHKTMHGK
jgi:hypothetical protein